jgi:hypothetical protein
MADLTQDEALERARVIEVDSYDVFLDLAAEPVNPAPCASPQAVRVPSRHRA